MSENTHYLKMPYIMPSQAQKHVTHNEALRMLDAIVQLSVVASGVNDPPSSPSEGERYIIGDNSSGVWESKADQIASFIDGAWMYFQPHPGWLAWEESGEKLLGYSGSEWREISGSGQQQVDLLGVNAPATEQERFVVRSDSVLFSSENADHRMKINKISTQDTASLLFQKGFSGRAEFGLTGEDNFVVKVSGDGGNWKDALRVMADDGSISLPAAGMELSSSLFSNLLPDSGRFHASDNQSSLMSNAAEAPGYIAAFNGANISFPSKFIFNNGTFGGSEDSLDADVSDLITTIFGAGGLRYGPEFWLMQIESGTGLSSTLTIEGEQYYRATIVEANPRPVQYTTSFFIRAESGKIALRPPTGQVNRLMRDGVETGYGTTGVIVVPSDGWVNFEIQVSRASLSYDQNDMSIMMQSGSVGYFALPKVVAGWVTIGSETAVLTNDRVFG